MYMHQLHTTLREQASDDASWMLNFAEKVYTRNSYLHARFTIDGYRGHVCVVDTT